MSSQSTETTSHTRLNWPFSSGRVLPNIEDLGGTLNALTMPSFFQKDSSRPDPTNPLSPLSLGDFTNATSFQKRTSDNGMQGRPPLRHTEGWHAKLTDAIHTALRRNASKANSRLVRPDGAFAEQMATIKPDPTLPAYNHIKKLSKDLLFHHQELYLSLAAKGEIVSPALIQALQKQNKLLTEVTKPENIPTMFDCWTILSTHQQIHASIKLLERDGSLQASGKAYQTHLDNSERCNAWIATWFSDALIKHLTELKLSLEVPVEHIPESISPASIRPSGNEATRLVDITISSHAKLDVGLLAHIVFGLAVGKSLLDEELTPASMRTALSKIGQTTEITKQWQQLNEAIADAMSQAGFSPLQTQSIMANNQLTISPASYAQIQSAAIESLQELAFLRELSSCHIYIHKISDLTYEEIRRLAGPQIPTAARPVAETPLQFMVLCHTFCSTLLGNYYQEETPPPSIEEPFGKLLELLPSLSPGSVTPIDLKPLHKGQHGELLNPSTKSSLLKAVGQLEHALKTQEVCTPHNKEFCLNLLGLIKDSLDTNHNRLAATERSR